jgi:hypothetical protein
MRRINAALAAAALLLPAGALYAADDAPSDGAAPWYKRPFGGKAKPPEKKAGEPAEKPPTREDVARSLKQEQAGYLERLNFCSKLRQIAAETNDEALLRKADDLEQTATDIYMQRTGKLKTLLENAEEAEAALSRKKPAAAAGTAWGDKPSRPTRAPNGRPLPNREGDTP